MGRSDRHQNPALRSTMIEITSKPSLPSCVSHGVSAARTRVSRATTRERLRFHAVAARKNTVAAAKTAAGARTTAGGGGGALCRGGAAQELEGVFETPQNSS